MGISMAGELSQKVAAQGVERNQASLLAERPATSTTRYAAGPDAEYALGTNIEWQDSATQREATIVTLMPDQPETEAYACRVAAAFDLHRVYLRHLTPAHGRTARLYRRNADLQDGDELNRAFLERHLENCSRNGEHRVIAAWGPHGAVDGRSEWFRQMAADYGYDLYAPGAFPSGEPIAPEQAVKKSWQLMSLHCASRA